MSATFLVYPALGACAGLLSGLFGIGGGVILVPFLAWLFTSQGFAPETVMLMAVATSLATIILTSLSSVSAHHRRGAVDWPTVFRLVPGILLGSVVGSMVADRMPGDMLRTVFACYLLIVSAQMGMQIRPRPTQIRLSNGQMVGAGGFIGTVSAILGIGGGTLTVPLLTKYRIPMRNAVAISAACGLPIAAAGTISYAVLGWQAGQLPDGCLGYIYLPAFIGIVAGSMPCAPLGARLAHYLPTTPLKRAFALFLLLVAIKLLSTA
jgi:uncharacterized protein